MKLLTRVVLVALAVAGFAQWFANYLIVQSFPLMLAGIGLPASYSFYGVCAMISFFLVRKFINETKGKELEEMEGWERPSSAGDAEVASVELG